MASPPRLFFDWGIAVKSASAGTDNRSTFDRRLVASVVLVLIVIACLVAHVFVSQRASAVENAADVIREFTAEVERVSMLEGEERILEITTGPVAYLRFEQTLRPVDSASAGQLGSIWTAVRREAIGGSLVDQDLHWILIKARDTMSQLDSGAARLARVQRFLAFLGSGLLIATLCVLAFYAYTFRRTSPSTESGPGRPDDRATSTGDDWLAEAGRRRFESVFDRLPVACGSFEIDGRVTAWNDAAEELTGKFSADVLQAPIWDAVEWRQMPDVIKSTLAKTFRGDSVDNVEWDYQHPNGERRQFRAKLMPYFSPSGKVTGGLIAIHDITVQREQERQLVESDETKAAILSALPDCLLRIDPYGRMVDLSHQPEFLDTPLDRHLQSTRWSEALPKALADELRASLALCRETYDPQTFEFHGEEMQCHVLVRLVPCGQGHILIILHDIEDRYRAEMATKDSETRLRYMIQGSADILSVVHSDATVTYQSPAVESVCGWTAEELVGDSLTRIVHPDDRTGLTKMLKALAKKPFGEARHACRILHQSGATLDVEILARNLLSNPYVNGIVLNTRDVTERHQLEQELERRIRESEAVNHRLEESKSQLESANEFLSRLATTDGLTGLNNHRAFQNELAVAMERAFDDGHDLSLILLDVDKFKEFNDRFGHIRGDAVLVEMGKILRQCCADRAYAARYGGEEFVVVLENADRHEAVQFAEDLRQQIESGTWADRPITASFGVATLAGARLAQSTFIHESDRALYASKERGRNCVTHVIDIADAA